LSSKHGPSLPKLDEDILPLQSVVKKRLNQNLFPNMDWMITSLRNLVFIKLGPPEEIFGRVQIYSRLLVFLLDWFFSEGRLPKSLLNLWISDFDFDLTDEVLSIAPPLRAFQVPELSILEEETYNEFHNIEQISGICFSSALALPHLPNLKAASGKYGSHFDNEDGDVRT